jgi:hypothetical protein
MGRPESSLNWFEIPVSDFERARDFYNKVRGCRMHEQVVMGNRMGFLPMEDPGIGGAIIESRNLKPSSEGPLIYLNGGEDLNIPLSRVETAGGMILQGKTKISDDIGYFAIFMDTEGNRLALHSMK